MKYRLGIIGIGNMGYALAKGVLDSGVLKKEEVWCNDLDYEKCLAVKQKLGINITDKPGDLFKSTSYILFAVKPQNLKGMLLGIKDSLVPGNVLISILAGIPTSHIEDMVGSKIPVIRVMPNAPAFVKKGMSALSKGRYASDDDLGFVEQLMKSVGRYVIVDEKYQNAVTALSGSGPAYFFLFCKYLFDAALGLGLDKESSKLLVNSTITGAAEMLEKSGHGYRELIDMVTSPGGTTERALKEFEKGRLRDIIESALEQAHKRAIELERSL